MSLDSTFEKMKPVRRLRSVHSHDHEQHHRTSTEAQAAAVQRRRTRLLQRELTAVLAATLEATDKGEEPPQAQDKRKLFKELRDKVTDNLQQYERHRSLADEKSKRSAKAKRRLHNQFQAIEQYAAILLRNDDHFIARKRLEFEEAAKRAEEKRNRMGRRNRDGPDTSPLASSAETSSADDEATDEVGETPAWRPGSRKQ